MPQCPPDHNYLAHRLLVAREQVGREPLVDTVVHFLEEAGAWDGFAAWEGALGVACAHMYLSLLLEAEEGLLEATFLKADFALEGAYQPPDPRAEGSPLEVLTVHGAKGLEFHTVFLPFLDWQPLSMGGRQPEPFLLEEIPGTKAHVLALGPPAWQKGQESSYRLVRELRDNRVLAEARRVFYVAVTRAQTRLFLSGVLSTRQGAWAPPTRSPLDWLWQHYRPGELSPGVTQLWQKPPLRAEIFPEPPPAQPADLRPMPTPPPWEFTPELPPYSFSFPSQEAALDLAGDSPAVGAMAGDGENLVPRARGEITHRLLETLAQGNKIPEISGLMAALVGAGVLRERASDLGSEILAEVKACLQEPFLQGLLAADAKVNEWLLEDQPAAGVIRRGRLDFLAFDGRDWWLVDFKTSRPPSGGNWEEFLLQESAKYRPQLLAYREMVAKARSISPPEAIRLALYFTAIRKVMEV